MSLCEPCSSIDFDRCFFGKQYHGIPIANTLATVGHMVANRDKCGMCSLIYDCLTLRHPHLLHPDNHKHDCLWFDSGDEEKTKILQVDVPGLGENFLSFNLIDDVDPPRPLRARDVAAASGPDVLVDILKSWLGTCKENHEQCRQLRSTKVPADLRLRLIDVELWCLVRAPQDSSYAALSYVWGTSPTVQTLKANVAEFSVEGSLRAAALPTTIASAIKLVKAMGLRYIWVDALCIVQDDKDDKAHQIQNMDSVYCLAEFTIVQASGSDSTSPLLGFDGPSDKKQVVGQVKDTRLALQWKGFDSYQRSSSTWTTRAWTFQEAVLSSRMLIWHNGHVTWECRQAVWCEDTVPGLPESHQKPHFGSRMIPLPPELLKRAAEEAAAQLFVQPTNGQDNISM